MPYKITEASLNIQTPAMDQKISLFTINIEANI